MGGRCKHETLWGRERETSREEGTIIEKGEAAHLLEDKHKIKK